MPIIGDLYIPIASWNLEGKQRVANERSQTSHLPGIASYTRIFIFASRYAAVVYQKHKMENEKGILHRHTPTSAGFTVTIT
jgi:hypothetical protein